MSRFERNSNVVQIELPLPNTSDAIWAKAEVIYDRFGSLFHGSGIRFVAMARVHQRLLRDWLRDSSWEPAMRDETRFVGRVRIVRPSASAAQR